MGKKSSKEKVMAAIGAQAPVMPRNRGYLSLQWEKKMLDGKKVTVFCIRDDGPCDVSGKMLLEKEYTDLEAFKTAVNEKLDSFSEK